MPFKAILFDFDGVLADSEMWSKDIHSTFLREFGVEYKGEYHQFVMGKNALAAFSFYREKFKLASSVEDLTRAYYRVAAEFYRDRIQLFPETIPVLEAIRERGLKCALVTSSYAEVVSPYLERQGIRRFFDDVVTGETVVKGKPAPDIYLMASERLSVAPRDCLVVEDSLAGVESGKSAGMVVAAIPDSRWANRLLYKEADDILDSLGGMIAMLDENGPGS